MLDTSLAARTRRWLLGIIAVGPLVLAAPVSAAPTGEYANFGDCPLNNPSASACLFSQTKSGEVTIGSTAVPIEKTITLQGGLTLENSEGWSTILAAANGETLSKTPQTVPGGILKVVAPEFLPGFLREILNELINKGPTGVTATTELAGTARIDAADTLEGTGTALELPVKVHLENTFLGSNCYIGSSSKPLQLDLTTGTTSPPSPNSPITGSPGELSFPGEGRIIRIEKYSLVNNSFSAPDAEGCGGLLSILVDPAVDAEVGLPSEAGHNTAILKGNFEEAGTAAVEEH